MPPKKSSQARHFSARFNPVTSEYDKEALKIVDDLIAQGFTFKQVAQDAILRAGGLTPEMFRSDDHLQAATIAGMERLLARFAEEIIREVGKGGFRGTGDSDDDEINPDVTPFANTFAKSFLQRQARGNG